MKVIRQEAEFVPVQVILETEKELKTLMQLLNLATNDVRTLLHENPLYSAGTLSPDDVSDFVDTLFSDLRKARDGE